MQKDANGEHYLTSTTTHQNPLYVPPPPPPLSSSNSCQSSTTPASAAAAQQQFHLIRLQSNPPPTQNNELHSNNQTMHIKQLQHTATVHGKTIINEIRFVAFSLENCEYLLQMQFTPRVEKLKNQTYEIDWLFCECECVCESSSAIRKHYVI